MKKILKQISSYRFRSLFFRMLTTILIMLTLILTCFIGISYRVSIVDAEERARTVNQNMLNKTSDLVDISLEHLRDAAISVYTNEEIISACVAPDPNRSDRVFSVQRILNSACSGNSMIDSIYLYTAYDQMVYVPDHEVCHVSGIPDLEEIMNTSNIAPLQDLTSSLCNINNQTYFLQGFPLPGVKRLGVLVFRLNEASFFNLVQGHNHGGSSIYVYDAFDIPVFSRNSQKTQTQLQEILQTARLSEKEYHLYTSDYSHFTYVYENSFLVTKQYAHSFLLERLPDLLIPILLGIVCAVIASRFAYKPIRDLLIEASIHAPIAGDQPGGIKVQNEIDYLHHLYSSYAFGYQEKDDQLRVLIPEFEARLLGDIIKTPMNEQQVQEYLHNIRSPLRGNGVFFTFVIATSQRGILSQIRHNLQTDMQQSSDFYACVAVIDDSHMAILIKFDALPPEEEARACLELLNQMAHKHLSAFPNSQFQIGISKPISLISTFPDAYLDATQSILMKNYLNTEERSVQRDISANSRAEEFVNKITAYVLSEKRENVEFWVKQLCHQQMRECSNSKDLLYVLRRVSDQLSQKCRHHEVEAPRSLLNMPSPPASYQEMEQLISETERLVTDYINRISPCTQGTKERLVFLAKEYISANYSNGFLSLADVANELQINASYLSTLFSTCSNMKFSEFLRLCRVDAAKEMLLHTDLSIKTIGTNCGFNSAQNFIRAFKQLTGESPSGYREIYKK